MIDVVGQEWWYEVRYPEQGFETANEIHIPIGQPVQVTLTSTDVIHSFWVPEARGKIDNIPGKVDTLSPQVDEPGVYRGQCAEYCGLQYAKMAFLVIAEPPEEFAAWVERQQVSSAPPTGDVAEEGLQVFLGASCVYCHTIEGTNRSGDLGPDLTHLVSRTLTAGTLPNSGGTSRGGFSTRKGSRRATRSAHQPRSRRADRPAHLSREPRLTQRAAMSATRAEGQAGTAHAPDVSDATKEALR